MRVNWTLVEDKMRGFKGECEHFRFNKCPIYTHDGASAKFSTNSQELDNSVENERFGLVFAKTGSINSGTDIIQLFRWQCANQSIIISTAFEVGQGMGLLEYKAMRSLRVSHDGWLCTFIV